MRTRLQYTFLESSTAHPLSDYITQTDSSGSQRRISTQARPACSIQLFFMLNLPFII